MRIIVNHRFYNTYEDGRKALGDMDTIPKGLPLPVMLCDTWELFRDGAGNATLIAYSEGSVVIEYFHAYFDEVQKIWRWQV